MPSGITPHPTKGVNPHMGKCPNCGKENGEILLLGNKDKIYKCTSCGAEHIGYSGACVRCKSVTKYLRDVDDGEAIPSGPCAECLEASKIADEEVKKGGVYWRCKECGSRGALKAESDLAKAVRESSKIAAPDPVGFEFTKENCPVCTEGKRS